MALKKRCIGKRVLLMFVLGVALATGSGCANPSDPDPEGTIRISQMPAVLEGSGWVLTGPRNAEGLTDQTLTKMPVGNYSLTWLAVPGYTTPFSEDQSLTTGGAIEFSGVYSESPSTMSAFVQIPTGIFEMGSPPDEPGRENDESQHTVTLTTPFELFNTEVTNQQYADLAQWALGNGFCTANHLSLQDALDGSIAELLNLDGADSEISFNGSTFIVDEGKESHPVQEVSWFGGAAYCDWLSLKAGYVRAYDHGDWRCNGDDPYGASGYRLPTEAEWEYACRAGSETAFANGEITNLDCDDPALDEMGWYCGNAEWETRGVGRLLANDLGLFDMHGNLWEWCNDLYAEYGGAETDPVGGGQGSSRVRRGGSGSYNSGYCRSATRLASHPLLNEFQVGFRPARSTNRLGREY